MKVPCHIHWERVVAFLLLSIAGLNLHAHTLPISYLQAVQDETYVHLELTINPFELNFSRELDNNRNGLLEAAEIAAADEKLAQRILERVVLKADGIRIAAESAGIAGEPTDHHLTIRAHFPIAASRAAISIDTDLQAVTSASHLTEVTFRSERGMQLARLDAQHPTAQFVLAEARQVVAEPMEIVPANASTAFFVVLALAFIPLTGVFVALLMFAPKHLREVPAHH
jgi:hypothetical protein